jgi:hypothetical protein
MNCIVCGKKVIQPHSKGCTECGKKLNRMGIAIKPLLDLHPHQGKIARCFYCGKIKSTFEANILRGWQTIFTCPTCIMKTDLNKREEEVII